MAREITTLAVPLVIVDPAAAIQRGNENRKPKRTKIILLADNSCLEFRVYLDAGRCDFQIDLRNLSVIALDAIEAHLTKPQEGL